MEDQQEEDSLVNQMAPGSDHDLPQSEAVDDDDLSPLISFNTCPGTSPAGNRLRYPRRLGRLGLRGRGLGGAGGQGLGSPGVEVDASEAAAATRRMPGVALSFSDTAESLWDRFGTPEAPRSVLMARAPALGKGPGIAPESRVEDEAIDGIDDGPDAIRTVPESGVEHGRGFVDRGLVADDGGNRNDPDDEVRVQNEVVVCEDDGQLEACDVHIIGEQPKRKMGPSSLIRIVRQIYRGANHDNFLRSCRKGRARLLPSKVYVLQNHGPGADVPPGIRSLLLLRQSRGLTGRHEQSFRFKMLLRGSYCFSK